VFLIIPSWKQIAACMYYVYKFMVSTDNNEWKRGESLIGRDGIRVQRKTFQYIVTGIWCKLYGKCSWTGRNYVTTHMVPLNIAAALRFEF
jgi:hypothetical protein